MEVISCVDVVENIMYAQTCTWSYIL